MFHHIQTNSIFAEAWAELKCENGEKKLFVSKQQVNIILSFELFYSNYFMHMWNLSKVTCALFYTATRKLPFDLTLLFLNDGQHSKYRHRIYWEGNHRGKKTLIQQMIHNLWSSYRYIQFFIRYSLANELEIYIFYSLFVLIPKIQLGFQNLKFIEKLSSVVNFYCVQFSYFNHRKPTIYNSIIISIYLKAYKPFAISQNCSGRKKSGFEIC